VALKALNDRWSRMQQIIEARANHPDYANIPGGRTGLLVRSVKQIGSGDSARLVEEFALDVALLKELRAHEKQAAVELAQSLERVLESLKPMKNGTTPFGFPARNERSRTDVPHGTGELSHRRHRRAMADSSQTPATTFRPRKAPDGLSSGG